MGKATDLTGQSFGRLTVIERHTVKRRRETLWVCRCECGGQAIAAVSDLRGGNTKSCGCLRSELLAAGNRSRATHGMYGTPEHKAWESMIRRCSNPNAGNYADYGARGIKVCERWIESFENFFEDMGLKPTAQHTLERDDTNGGYGPDNCRWATMVDQQNNKRSNHFIEFNGEKLTVAQWARRIGVADTTIHSRLRSGWSIGDALTDADHRRRSG